MFMFNISYFSFLYLYVFYFITLSFSFIIIKSITTSLYILLFIIILSLLLIFAISLFFKSYFYNSTFYFTTTNLTENLPIIDFNFNFNFNFLSLSFIILVLIIGCTTNFYILNYFKNEAAEKKFIFLINTFIFSMIFLLMADNFFSIFLGWELIGLSSFFLINFWNLKKSTLKSSFKAFTFNLFSDLFLLIAFVYFYQSTNVSDCTTFFFMIQNDLTVDTQQIYLGLIFLTLSASIKSVQFIGHLWLPDSMEAPVPASSLIHSATLVSAGIYLLCKFNLVYSLYNTVQWLVTWGALTAAYGGVVAAVQTDLKKILAYSTMSHCGFLWVIAAFNNLTVLLLYLFLHGLFKAATFYCAGSFIRHYGTQDTRLMGQGSTYLVLDTALLIICAANLAGLPFTIGVIFKVYFFKLLLLNTVNVLTYGLLTIGLLSGLVYFFQIIFYSCFDFYKNVKYLSINLVSYIKIIKTNLKIINLNHFLAVVILLIFSLIVVTLFYFISINSLSSPINTYESLTVILSTVYVNQLYSVYFIVFYFLYLLIFILLYFVTNKKHSGYLINICIFIYFLATLFFLF